MTWHLSGAELIGSLQQLIDLHGTTGVVVSGSQISAIGAKVEVQPKPILFGRLFSIAQGLAND